jgi:hypothetical protein
MASCIQGKPSSTAQVDIQPTKKFSAVEPFPVNKRAVVVAAAPSTTTATETIAAVSAKPAPAQPQQQQQQQQTQQSAMGKDQLESYILKELQGTIADTLALAQQLDVSHDDIVGVVKSLWAGGLILADQADKEETALTPEGLAVVEAGKSPEYAFLEMVASSEGSKIALAQLQESDQVGLKQCFSKKWIGRVGKDALEATKKPSETRDEALEILKQIHSGTQVDEASKKDLLARKLLKKVKKTWYKTSKGPKY